MIEERNLLVGFDLCNDYSQISCYNNSTFEPETIKYDYNSDNELLLTIMAVDNKSKEWLFAEEAEKAIIEGTAEPIRDIVKSVVEGTPITVQGKQFDAVEVLSIYFRKSLSLINHDYPNDSILKLVITIEKTDIILINAIFKALEKLDIRKDRVSVQSHAQSYIYYALSQKKELWMNDVALFHFDIEGLKYYQINMDRRHRPIMVGVLYKDFSDTLSFELLEQKHEKQAELLFENIAATAFHKQIVTTVYLTGRGFNGKWYESVLKGFSQGKRVFKGQNLFSEGACFAAKEHTGGNKFDEFTFMSEDMITGYVSVNVYYDAKEQELIFAKPALPWYEADKSYEFILNNSNEIEVIVRNGIRNTKKSFIIVLDLMNVRPNKATRVRMRVKFIDAVTCVVTIKDMGFGEFFPATNRVWEKIITIE